MIRLTLPNTAFDRVDVRRDNVPVYRFSEVPGFKVVIDLPRGTALSESLHPLPSDTKRVLLGLAAALQLAAKDHAKDADSSTALGLLAYVAENHAEKLL